MTPGTNANQTRLVLRLLVAAMAGGMLVFAAIAIVAVTAGSVTLNSELTTTLLAVLGLFAVGALVAYAVVRRSIVSKARQIREQQSSKEDPTAALLPTYSVVTIVSGALAEGFGLFGTVVFLLTGSWPALAAPVLALLALAAIFPSRDRLSRFGTAATSEYR
jgi:hypothetical protein